MKDFHVNFLKIFLDSTSTAKYLKMDREILQKLHLYLKIFIFYDFKNPITKLK